MTVRDRRLRADYRRLEQLTADSELIEIRAGAGDPPEQYSVLLRCAGIASMRAGIPVPAEEHRVELLLTADYPLSAPVLRCTTPVFHPNIDFNTGIICINTWYPGRLLDELIVTIGRMIRYQNYNPASALNVEAARWALLNQHRFPFDERAFRRGNEDQRTPDGFRIRIVGVP